MLQSKEIVAFPPSIFIENLSVWSIDININKSAASIRKDIFSVSISLYKITYIVLSKPSLCKGTRSHLFIVQTCPTLRPHGLHHARLPCPSLSLSLLKLRESLKYFMDLALILSKIF